MTITTVGLDLAKNILQVHAVYSAGRVVARQACVAAKCYRSSPSWYHAWSACRPAAHLLLHGANVLTRFGCAASSRR